MEGRMQKAQVITNTGVLQTKSGAWAECERNSVGGERAEHDQALGDGPS